MFTHISRTNNQQFLVRASYLEIYQVRVQSSTLVILFIVELVLIFTNMYFIQEEIKDLLSKDHKKKLDLKERPDTGIYVKVNLVLLTTCYRIL